MLTGAALERPTVMAFLGQVSYYELLGVCHQATVAEIEAAYTARMSEIPPASWRRLVLQARTGRSPAALANARDTLVDSPSRATYDASLQCMFFWMPLQ
jgi:DnaJ-class molecular chaperone